FNQQLQNNNYLINKYIMHNPSQKQKHQASLEQLLSILKESPFKYNIKSQVQRYFEKQIYEENRSIECSIRPQNEEEKNQLKQYEKQIKQIYLSDKEKFIQLQDFSFNQSLNESHLFPSYQKINDLKKNEETELKHKNGEILLLDVWATWCGPCQQPMQHNQEMLEKYENQWKDNVRIVGVSVDDNRDVVLKRIDDKKWDKIEHLKLNGWDGEHPLLKDFQVNGIPFVCLVGKDGQIIFKGHPSSINLEDKINSLLKQGEQQGNQQQENKSDVIDFIKSINEDIKYLTNIFLQMLFNNKGEFQRKFYEKPQIIYSILKKDKQLIEENLLNKLVEKINKDIFEIKEDLIETLDIEQGEQCNYCQKKLEIPYFYNHFKKEYVCYQCGNEKDESKQFIEQFKVPYNLILINTHNPLLLKNIEVYKLGKNIQPVIGQDYSKEVHGYGCNGDCQVNDRKTRFICLNCRPGPYKSDGYIDYCESCVNRLIIEKKQESIQRALERDKHSPEHLLFKFLTPFNKGYNKY
ncbi:thiol:disulfide interchange protein, putative, partial [Ichthyophthirius multifiliis]